MFDIATSEADFYSRKIIRLQTDLATLQQELTAARVRLRTAEDFQIKYQLLLRQSHQENHRLKYLERAEQSRKEELLNSRIRQNDLKWEKLIEDKEKQIRQEYAQKIQNQQKQIRELTRKALQQNSKNNEAQLLQFKVKKINSQKKALQQQIDELKFAYEEQKNSQINHFKENVIAKNNQKHAIEKKNYQQKIQHLQHQLQRVTDQLHFTQVKNNQNHKPDNLNHFKDQINQIHLNHQKQIASLKELFKNKNQEVTKLIQQKIQFQENLQKIKKQMREENQNLINKVFQKQNTHQIQLFNLKQRMTSIRTQQVQQLKKQLKRSEETFGAERSSWQNIIHEKSQEAAKSKARAEEQISKNAEDRAKMKKKIQQLKERLKEAEGSRELGQTEQLLLSLRETEAKDDNFANYEHGIVFLQSHIKKLQNKLEQKNLQIEKLLKDKKQLIDEHHKEIQENRQKIKREKKNSTDRIIELEEQNRQLNQLVRERDRQIKKVIKDQQNKRVNIEIQNKSLRDLTKQLQNDYNRLNQHKKNVEKSFRDEREKALGSKSEVLNVQRQKWIEKEKLKNDLEVIFQQKAQQLKIDHQIEKQKLRLQRDKLKQQNEILKQSSKLQSEELDKLRGNDYQSIQNNKLAQHHKKMASLNLQIALTENLYNSLLSAKSRVKDIHLQGINISRKSQVKIDTNQIHLIDDQIRSGEESPAFRDPILNDTFGLNEARAKKNL